MSPSPPPPLVLSQPYPPVQPDWFDPISILFLLLGLFFIVFGLASHLIRGKFFIPSSVVATLFGILLGPKGFGILASPATDSGGWSDGSENEEAREFLRWGCRVVLGIQVLAAGILLPTRYLAHRKNLLTLTTLLFPVMISSSLLSALFAYLLIPGMGWYEALVIGACLGPTDPVLAGSVIKGHFADRHVEKSLRDVLLCESGANDGLGTPILLLALSLLVSNSSEPPPSAPTTSLQLLTNFLTSILLYNTILSLVAGAAIGFAVRFLLIQSRRRGWIDEDSMLVFSLATSFAIIGSMTLLNTNTFLACFVAGVFMSWDDEVADVLHTKFSEGLDNLIDILIFSVLGSVLPFDSWISSSSPISFGRLVSLAVLVLLFRRLPGVLFFSKGLPAIQTWGKTIFLGWFGPMGIGALYYALEADVSSSSLATQIYTIVSFIIFASIFVHGLTIREHHPLSSRSYQPPTRHSADLSFVLSLSPLHPRSPRPLSPAHASVRRSCSSPAFFLLLTHLAPSLAPRLLGERKAVGQDFGGGDHLLTEEGDDVYEEGEERRGRRAATETDSLLPEAARSADPEARPR